MTSILTSLIEYGILLQVFYLAHFARDIRDITRRLIFMKYDVRNNNRQKRCARRSSFFLHLRSDIHYAGFTGVGDFSKSADAATGGASLTRI